MARAGEREERFTFKQTHQGRDSCRESAAILDNDYFEVKLAESTEIDWLSPAAVRAPQDTYKNNYYLVYAY